MGLDIHVWKEEFIESKNLEDGGRETIIRKTDVYQDRGWAIGQFLQDTFDLDNSQTATIDLNEAYREVTEETKTLSRNDDDAKNEGYEESLNELLAVLVKGKEENSDTNNTYAEYFWELWW
jgi:hypothetical protein